MQPEIILHGEITLNSLISAETFTNWYCLHQRATGKQQIRWRLAVVRQMGDKFLLMKTVIKTYDLSILGRWAQMSSVFGEA